ncbi:MAG TPA: nucleoside 2-deoxyribosyltransferase [Candidatus Saccharimonadales bacterium]|nr:nucleoside 2-deoxyribosyltransferase [Candidatus Saccharimonadales bacterium]
MKKIYFACAISSGRDHADAYHEIVKIIKGQGLHVLSDYFADKTVEALKGPTPHLKPPQIWQDDVNMIKEAHAIIAEVTQPSLGVGYEIAIAHEWGKPVLALYHPRPGHRLSSMIIGSPNVMVFEYKDVSETVPVIADFISQLG